MADAAAWEPIDQLLRGAKEAGRSDVTRTQLRRWQRVGLLPRPKQRGLGRGRGTEVLYPPGSTRQLIALCEQLETKRSLIDACWVLWWNGYAVAEKSIRVLLDVKAAQLEFLKAQHERGETGELLEKMARGRLPEPLRLMRKRTGPAHFEGAFRQLLEFGLGRTGQSASRGASGVAKALHLEDDSSFETQLRETSPAYDPAKLREALDASSLEDLEAARDSLRALLLFPEGLIAMLQAETGQTPPLAFRIPLRRLNLDDGLYLVLLWLSASRASWAQEVAEAFTSLVRAVAKGFLPTADALESEIPTTHNAPAKEGPPGVL